MNTKKTLIIVLAVAILGGAGLYHKSHDPDSQTTFKGYINKNQSTGTANASPTAVAGSSTASSTSGYKDGTYKGAAEETAYGTVQIAAVISGGQITDIKFIQMPGPEEHSKEVTAFSKDPLKQSTLSKQNANIDFVSGATQTSEGYQQSLQSALDQA